MLEPWHRECWTMPRPDARIVAFAPIRRVIAGRLSMAAIEEALHEQPLEKGLKSGALGLVWLIAGYALVFGVTLIILGFELRHVRALLPH